MKITSEVLAKVCVALLILYPAAAILMVAYLSTKSYGIMAAIFAANAGMALLVRLTFGLPEFSHSTSSALRLFVILIGVTSGLLSAVYWMADEADHIWLRVGIISLVLVILFLLMWFIDKVKKEGTKHEGE